MNALDFDYNWTLADPCVWQGVGLHGGQPNELKIFPHNQPGLFFLDQQTLIPLTADLVSQTHFCTTLKLSSVSIQTVEHVLAALLGLGISSAVLSLKGTEIPILDGSSAIFARDIMLAGRVALPQRRTIFSPSAGEWGDEQSWLRWQPAKQLMIHYQIDYQGPPPLKQTYIFNWSPENFLKEIAEARTFVYFQEVQKLQRAGLAQGGSRENALVIENAVPAGNWRWPDEPVRHKILDFLGDLALLGSFPKAQIWAYRTGHEAHVTMVKSWLGKTLSGS
jgi:UDP-3-O-[3-hydroxymyristoyl] N-acetylglucosamine deacetylase